MSQKSGKKSVKAKSQSILEQTKTHSKVSIKISELENLEQFGDRGLEILVKLSEDLSDNKKLTSFKNQCDLTFTFDVEVDDEDDVLNLFSNPVLMTLSKFEDSTVIGHANLDLYPFCSYQIENWSRELQFEKEVRDKQVQFYRKISFKVEASCDVPLLKKPIANSLYVKFGSIYNLPKDLSDTTEVKLTATVPLGFQLNKSTSFVTNLNSCESRKNGEPKLKWCHLVDISGKGAESTFQPTFLENALKIPSCNPFSQVNFNAISRIFLSNESNKFLHDHLRKSFKLPLEVMIDGEHFLGIFHATDLLHIDRRHVQHVVPLLKFDSSLLSKNCNVQSAFTKPVLTPNAKKSKKEHANKNTSLVQTIQDNQDGSVSEPEGPFVNEDGQQVFITVEMELEKPLNHEVFEDCHEILLVDDQSLIHSPKEKPLTFGKFQSNLEAITKKIMSIYDTETDVHEIMRKMLADGYFSLIEDHLISQIPVEDSLDGCPNPENSITDFLCKLTSFVLNKNHQVQDHESQDLLAQVFNFLGKEKQANEIFLHRIYISNSEESWIDYAVHSLKKEEFNKSMVCVDKALAFNQFSIIGHILKAYVAFKQKKRSESQRLISFMQFKHGDSIELEMIQRVISLNDWPKKCEFHNSVQSKSHHRLEQIYEKPEILWSATETDMLLSWQDPSIRTTVFFIKLGCYDFAELALSEYYKNRGVNVNYSYLLAVIDAAKGEYAKALIHLNKISKHDIANHQLNYDKIVVLMALMLMKTGKNDQAMKLLSCQEKIEHQKPEHFLINFMFGSHLNNTGELCESLKLLTQSHRILPSHLTLMELGKCYQNLNKSSSAEKCFHQSISFDQDTRDAWLHLYRIYLESNRDDLVQLSLEVLST